MSITTDKNSQVKFFCSECSGDGEVYEDSDYGPESSMGVSPQKCKKCDGTGKVVLSTIEWMKKNLGTEVSTISGLYTFDDMMKAFELGVRAESGDFPHEDYMGAEKVIKKYFIEQSENKDDTIPMPRELTSENGSKGLVSGEFFELIEVPNPEYCGCGECDFCKDFSFTPENVMMSVPISWTNIKDIYKMLVKYHSK